MVRYEVLGFPHVAAEELLRDPSLKDVIKVAIDNGVEVVTWD